MVLSILSSLILVDQNRRLVEVFPDHVKKEWNKWNVRGLVLVSLAVQMFLICSGNRRKYIAKRRIRFFIWSAYMMADWVATVALGLLVDRQGNPASSGNSKNEYGGDLTLMAFWAPFLLLHLGGPDTITAYALADNELWLRHLLGLVVQTVAATYVTLLAWEGTRVSFLTIPMLLCGIIKYGERTWVLMSANRDHFRDSLLTSNDPGPSYANFMEEFSLKEAEGYIVNADSPGYDLESTRSSPSVFDRDESRSLHIAYYFFETLKFKWLFVDLNLGFDTRDESKTFFQKQDYRTAFEVIEAELGFAYDVFYTKAPVIYTPFGLYFRLMTFLITLTVLLTFAASIGVKSHEHQLVDVVITFILLIGAMLLELYALGSLLLSDWAYIWLSRNSSKNPLFGRCLGSKQESKRWSNSMYQCCLLDFCVNEKPLAFRKILRFTLRKILRFTPMHNTPMNLWQKMWSFRKLKHLEVSPVLKFFIFRYFIKQSNNTELEFNDLITCRGSDSLKRHDHYDKFKWTVDVQFDHSILIWHIATDLCYNLTKSKTGRNYDSYDNKQAWEQDMIHSKTLAHYMLYISAMSPFMLPIEIGVIRLRDTCAEASLFFKEKNITSKLEVYEMLAQVNTTVFPSTVKGGRSKSVLFEACKLAALLQEIGDPNKMWKMVAELWVEMLAYAARQCRGYDHAQQLEKGGELLTHVWLLMEHLGISEQYMKEGDGRVKLAVT